VLNFLKRFNLFGKVTEQSPIEKISEQDLALFAQHINELCDNIEEKNLTLVSNTVESTSGHNNHRLVQAAGYFVKECVWMFNSEYASEYVKADYFNEFIVYIKEVQHEFEQHHYDPDGVGGGTITDIVKQIQNHQIK